MAINVLITVNANLIVDKKGYTGTEDSPISLGANKTSDNFVSMIAQNSVVKSNDGKSELEIQANSNDTITWSINTFDNMSDHSASLYGGHFSDIKGKQTISALTYSSNPIACSLPKENAENPLKPGAIERFQNQVCSVSGKVIYLPPTSKNDKVTYHMRFRLTDATGKKVGYFKWDPFIKITPLNP